MSTTAGPVLFAVGAGSGAAIWRPVGTELAVVVATTAGLALSRREKIA